MAKILYTGNYEIEKPKFQPGDKVVRETGGKFLFNQLIVEVIGVSKNQWFEQQIEYEIEGCSYFLGSEYVRHATPEEIYWMETLGREKVGDFKIGDLYVDGNDTYTSIDQERHISLAQEWYEEDDFLGIYPAESYKPFPKESKS